MHTTQPSITSANTSHSTAMFVKMILAFIGINMVLIGCADASNHTPSLTTTIGADDAPSLTHTRGVTATATTSISHTDTPQNTATDGVFATTTLTNTLDMSSTTPTSMPTLPIQQPTATPLPTMAEQTAALLPAFATDMEQAHEWDQYVITATLNPAEQTISGITRVRLTNHTDMILNEVYFHLYPNHVDFAGGSLWVQDVVDVDGVPMMVTTTQDGVLLRVPLPQPLTREESTTIVMPFRTHTPVQQSGAAYGAFNQEAGVWALASCYPTLARLLPDGWDTRTIDSIGDLAVTETALYDVTLEIPDEWELVTTGVAIETTPAAAGWRRERFVSGPQRDFFIAATYGLEQQTALFDGIRIVSHYQPHNAATGQQIITTAAQAIATYNTHYGQLPINELDIVQTALTNFAGVEYPGVILIEQTLYADNTAALCEETVAHEVAHQWWYNIVGNDAKQQPWLDEGLASYSQIVYYESVGDEAAATHQLETFRALYQQARAAGVDDRLNQPTTAFNGNYVALVYGKSALFLHTLRLQMGNALFFQFLRRYYVTYRYRMASSLDMMAVAEETCQCQLDALFDEWVEQATEVEMP